MLQNFNDLRQEANASVPLCQNYDTNLGTFRIVADQGDDSGDSTSLPAFAGQKSRSVSHGPLITAQTDDRLQKFEAGERSGDRVWQLPSYPEYDELITGKHADLQNIGPPGEAGTITAGVFLQHFVNDVPWVHLDIAGTAWGVKGIEYHPANSASGSGVRILIDFLENLSESKS